MGRSMPALGVALLLLLFSQPGAAHSLQVFAMADGDRITGRAYFAGGHPARGAQIRVLAADGEQVAALTPDAEGEFEYRPGAARDFLVVAESADGHRAEWPIAASELLGAELAGAFAAAEPAGDSSERSASAQGGESAASSARAAVPGANDPRVHEEDTARAAAASGQIFDAERPMPEAGRCSELCAGRVSGHISGTGRLDPAMTAAIERAVARQVRPLREALAQAQGRAQLRDILGGIGYILGIAGIGIWWTSRQRRRRDGVREQR